MEQRILHVETEAHSLDDAVESALKQLNCTRADVEIDVLQVHSAGFLGIFGKRSARVCVRVHDRGVVARQIVAQLLSLSGLTAEVELLPAGKHIELNLHSDETNLLIGRYGQTLDALQSLAASMVDRLTTDRMPILIDVDGYRQRRQAFLLRLYKRLARKVTLSGKPTSTPPLVLSERLVLYDYLKADTDLETYSKYHDGYRKIIMVQPRD